MKKTNLFASIFLVLIFLIFLQSCKPAASSSTFTFSSKEDFSNRNIAAITGTVLDSVVDETISNITWHYYDDTAGSLEALKRGDVDASLTEEPVANVVASQRKEFLIFPELIVSDNYGYILKKGSNLTDEFSSIITGFREDGTLERLKDKWLSGNEEEMHIDWTKYNIEERGNGTIKYAYEPSVYPMCYIDSSAKASGYEVELLLLIANKLDMGVEIMPTSFSSIINFVQTGKADVASGCISITEERAKEVDFPVSHYKGGSVFLCRAENLSTENKSESKTSFFTRVKESFEKTFVKENRWLLIFKGLGVTLLISFSSAIIGTILGFLLLVLSRKRGFSLFLNGFSSLLRGVPALVVLLIFYFVFFGSVNVSPIIVSIVTFSIIFSVSVLGILQTGINAIDNGQWDAAVSLGFGKKKAFMRIIMPQALRHILPLYKGEVVGMMKLTSIVGYIAIQDLTKAGDIIRSRTYEAFFPLLTVALIYFLLSSLICFFINCIEVGLKPKDKKKEYSIKEWVEEDKNEYSSLQNKEKASVIEIEHLKKKYENAEPLKDVNAIIKEGEVVTIIGPSGTGKSTLIRCINRLEVPTSGTIKVFGEDINDKKTDLKKLRSEVGMVFQNFNLFNHLNVIENIVLAPITLKKEDKEKAYAKAMHLLKMVGMAEKAFSYPSELSGGQKQRVAIARTLAMEPKVILFDEPTSALDPTRVGEVLSVVKLLAKKNMTMMIVTHEMSFAHDVSTRIFYMDEGIVYEDGTPDEIFNHPQKNKTRAFIRRLKVLSLVINSEDYDFISMNEKIQSFGEKNMLQKKRINNIRLLFEELVAVNIIPNSSLNYPLEITIEYDERKNEVEMHFEWKGEEYNPLKSSDEISICLIKNACTSGEYNYSDGVNHLVIKL